MNVVAHQNLINEGNALVYISNLHQVDAFQNIEREQLGEACEVRKRYPIFILLGCLLDIIKRIERKIITRDFFPLHVPLKIEKSQRPSRLV